VRSGKQELGIRFGSLSGVFLCDFGPWRALD
jgi:hypothetical protein